MNEDQLRRLAAWWRGWQGDDSFRTATHACAYQLEIALAGELEPGFEATVVYQGGTTLNWVPK